MLPKNGFDLAIPDAEQDREQKRLLMLGQMTDMVLRKSQRYGLSLPPGLEQLKAESRKLIEPANQRQ